MKSHYEDPKGLKLKHPDWEIEFTTHSNTPKLLTFGQGGHTLHFGDGHTQSGYRSIRDYFDVWHWWADQCLKVTDITQYEGVPFIDMCPALVTKEGLRMVLSGPMVKVDLADEEVDICPEPSGMMAAGLMGQRDKTFAAMLGLHKASKKSGKYSGLGPLDSVSTKQYMELWREAGGTVGYIRDGKFVVG